MASKNKPQPHIRLIQALVVSAGINVVALGFLFHSWTEERPPIPYYVLKPAEENQKQMPFADERGNEEIIRNFKSMSIEQLVSKLNNSQLIENGYTQRDLALGSLTTFHHFNLNRALLGLPTPQQQRSFAVGASKDGPRFEVYVYPGLTEQQFQAIIHYATTEQWPYTSKGLFLMLQKPEFQTDSSLAEAFFLTPEFPSVEMLFSRAEVPVTKNDILNLLQEGNWDMLNSFAEQQRMSQDLSAAKRQKFLLDYLAYGSKTAAFLLLKTDLVFAIKKLDDPTVLTILQLQNEKNPETEKFALEMLTSPRGDAVWQQAALRLYEFSGDPIPSSYTRATVLARFSPHSAEAKKNQLKLIESKTNGSKPLESNKLQASSIKITPPSPSIPKNTTSTKAAATTKKTTAPIAKSNDEKSPAKIVAGKPPEKIKPAPKLVTKPQKEIATLTYAPKTKAIKKDRLYIVQEGDSLWKISKRFNIDVEVIKKHNQLSSNALKPGTSLRIP